MNKREIPKKNYFILLFIMLLTVALVFYLISWYNTTKEYYKNNSVMMGFLAEIKPEEIENYLIDNPDIAIYIASSKDNDVKSFEKSFKKLITEEEIKDNIIYLDDFQITDDKFYNDLKSKYFSESLKSKNINLITKSNIVIIEDKKIIDVLYKKESSIPKVRDVKNLFIKHGIILND
ncbi:MAG: hypothetical protein PHD10_02285 [Bacilli bacterium]|nr:hypothetical protein [Bacilli bacterium]MDD4607941.1 hypothetical protein [Bacilli bacterium]